MCRPSFVMMEMTEFRNGLSMDDIFYFYNKRASCRRRRRRRRNSDSLSEEFGVLVGKKTQSLRTYSRFFECCSQLSEVPRLVWSLSSFALRKGRFQEKTLNGSQSSKANGGGKKKRGLDPISSPLVAIKVVKHPGWIPNRFFHSTIRRH
jgi:hypothetical protein